MKRLSNEELWQKVEKLHQPKEHAAKTEGEEPKALTNKADQVEVEVAEETPPEPPAQNTGITASSDDKNALMVAGPGDFFLDKAEPMPPKNFPNQPAENARNIPATIPNVLALLRHYKIIARYDMIKKKDEFIVPGVVGTTDNIDAVSLENIVSLMRLNNISSSRLEPTLLAIADRHPYNPVATWINSKPWDGVDRLGIFYQTLVTTEDFDQDFKNMLIFRWLLSAVAAVFKPQGFKARGVLTLQGDQSLGKTTWFSNLIPDDALRDKAIKTDHHMDAGEKDSKIAAATHWIVEIGELESSFRRDIARLKGFITADSDKVRLPYGRTTSNFPRRTVFCATVNDARFLVDATGNTRWWTIPVVDVDYEHPHIDMQQVWAQVAVAFHKGERWWLSKEEEQQLENFNNDHRVINVVEEELMTHLDLSRKNDAKLPAMTATEVLQKLGFKHITNNQAKECASVLRRCLGNPKKIQGYMKWRVPVINKTNFDDDFELDDEE